MDQNQTCFGLSPYQGSGWRYTNILGSNHIQVHSIIVQTHQQLWVWNIAILCNVWDIPLGLGYILFWGIIHSLGHFSIPSVWEHISQSRIYILVWVIYLGLGHISWTGSYILVWVIYLNLGHKSQSGIFFPVCNMLGSHLGKDIYFGLGHHIYPGLGHFLGLGHIP